MLKTIGIFLRRSKKILPWYIKIYGDPPKHTLKMNITPMNHRIFQKSYGCFLASSIPMGPSFLLISGSLRGFVDI
jgi:hypothetical protein